MLPTHGFYYNSFSPVRISAILTIYRSWPNHQSRFAPDTLSLPDMQAIQPLPAYLNPVLIAAQVQAALLEDIGDGDLTAQLIALETQAHARIISRERALLCGTPWLQQCFLLLDPHAQLTWHAKEGDWLAPDQLIVEITGNARALLSAERTALNFLQTLSAVATHTRHYVEAIAGLHTHILDTRKTIPGMRLAQKYAVWVAGGANQRLALYDGILIKENHIAAAGSIAAVLHRALALAGKASVQIEVESLEELKAALTAGADSILLDNFSLDDLTSAVAITQGRALLEASGNVDLTTVRAIAETGVDRISIGGLTKHIQAIDLSMRIQIQA